MEIPPGQVTSLALPTPQGSPDATLGSPNAEEKTVELLPREEGNSDIDQRVANVTEHVANEAEAGTAIQPTPTAYTAEQVAYLRGQGIVKLEGEGWVRPTPNSGGGSSRFEPVDPQLFLPGMVPYGGDTGKRISARRSSRTA